MNVDTVTRRTLSDEHKAALARGRRQGKVVRDYLAALESRPRGRRITTVELEARLQRTVEELGNDTIDPVHKVKLIQERINLEKRIAKETRNSDIEKLEEEFVKAAKPWAESHGVTYIALRKAGVPAAVLKESGLAKAS